MGRYIKSFTLLLNDNNKIKKIFILLSIFLLLSLIIFSNIANVHAYTISNSSLYVCDNSTVKSGYSYTMDGQNYFGDFGTLYNGAISAFTTNFNAEISTGHNYTLEINSYNGDFRNITDETVIDFVGITSHCSNDTTDYVINSVESSYYKITINFTSNSTNNYSRLTIYNRNNSLITGVNNFKIDNLSLVDHGDVLDSVINNQNANTNAILENQQENTSTIIDSIEEQYENCEVNLINSTPSYNSQPDLFSYSFSGNKLTLSSTGGSTGFISFPLDNIEKNTNYIVSYKTYNSNTRNSIFRVRTGATEGSWLTDQFPISNNQEFTFNSGNSNTAYLWFYFLDTTPINVTIYDLKIYNTDYCINKLDETNDQLAGINDSITNQSPPDTDNFLGGLQNLVQDGPITSLILLPISLLNRYVEGFNGTCSPIHLGSLYGTDLTLPCINLSSVLGDTLWNIIDSLVSIFFIYNIGLLFVSAFNSVTSLRDTFDSLYTPRHARPIGKHTSEVE